MWIASTASRLVGVKRLVPAILVIALSACGAQSASVDSSVATTESSSVPTTAGATTTTVVATKNPPSGEQAITCDVKAISASYGEKVKAEACTATWAVGDTDRDTWNCPKEGCEQTRLFKLVNNKWSVVSICYRDQPLTHYNRSCYIPNAGPATLAEIPPSDVACTIWSTNRALKWVEETGCEPRQADINAALSGKCDGYFDASSLPVERCDHGPAVSEMQKRLRTAGYSTQVDGYFGEAMAKAVYAFQDKNKLMKSGIIDSATWKALEPNQSTLPGTDRNGDGLVTPDEFR
jgi:hypothetical protein